MSHSNIKLIDLGFSNRLNDGIPAFRQLLINTDALTDEEIEYLVTYVYSISKLEDPLFNLLDEIMKKIIQRNKNYFPIKKYVDSENIIAYKLICSRYSDFDINVQNEYLELLFNKFIGYAPSVTQFLILKEFYLSYSNDELIKLMKNYINNKYDLKVYYIVDILTRKINVDIYNDLNVIISNIKIGIDYDGHMDIMVEKILDYFNKNKYTLDKELIRELLLKNKENNGNCVLLSKIMLHSYSSNSEIVLDYLEYDIKNNNYKFSEALIDALVNADEIDIKNFNYNRLLKIIHPTKTYFNPLYHKLVYVFAKMDNGQDALLIPFLKSNYVREVEFATSIFQQKQRKISEILNNNPLLEIYNTFYINNIFNNNDELQFLRKKHLNEFDFKIYLLFTFCGFNVLIVDPPSTIPNIDLIAYSPFNEEIFLIGCTSNIIKDDASHIFANTKKIKDKLPAYTITPIICTALNSDAVLDVKKLVDNKIGILTGEKIESLINIVRNDPLHAKILSTLHSYLSNA